MGTGDPSLSPDREVNFIERHNIHSHPQLFHRTRTELPVCEDFYDVIGGQRFHRQGDRDSLPAVISAVDKKF